MSMEIKFIEGTGLNSEEIMKKIREANPITKEELLKSLQNIMNDSEKENDNEPEEKENEEVKEEPKQEENAKESFRSLALKAIEKFRKLANTLDNEEEIEKFNYNQDLLYYFENINSDLQDAIRVINEEKKEAKATEIAMTLGNYIQLVNAHLYSAIFITYGYYNRYNVSVKFLGATHLTAYAKEYFNSVLEIPVTVIPDGYKESGHINDLVKINTKPLPNAINLKLSEFLSKLRDYYAGNPRAKEFFVDSISVE